MTISRTPQHEELLRRFGAPTAQRYSEVLLHVCLLLPFGEAEVHDAWIEGEWSIQIVFRQPGFDGLIRTGRSVLDASTPSQPRLQRFITPNGGVAPYPPEPRLIAFELVAWMTEPIGNLAADLVPDESGIYGLKGARVGNDDEPPKSAFGQQLSHDEIAAVRARLVDLDDQLRALNARPRRRSDSTAASAIPPERFRHEDYLRLREERRWLASWL